MQEIKGLVQDEAILPTRQIPTHFSSLDYHDYYLIDIARPQGRPLSSRVIFQYLPLLSFHRVVSCAHPRRIATPGSPVGLYPPNP